jgi:FMN-dependent NADH-azoreductase
VSRNTIVATPNGPVTCTNAAPCLNFNVNSAFKPVFGTMSNANSNFAYTQRQLQLGARFFF